MHRRPTRHAAQIAAQRVKSTSVSGLQDAARKASIQRKEQQQKNEEERAAAILQVHASHLIPGGVAQLKTMLPEEREKLIRRGQQMMQRLKLEHQWQVCHICEGIDEFEALLHCTGPCNRHFHLRCAPLHSHGITPLDRDVTDLYEPDMLYEDRMIAREDRIERTEERVAELNQGQRVAQLNQEQQLQTVPAHAITTTMQQTAPTNTTDHTNTTANASADTNDTAAVPTPIVDEKKNPPNSTIATTKMPPHVPNPTFIPWLCGDCLLQRHFCFVCKRRTLPPRTVQKTTEIKDGNVEDESNKTHPCREPGCGLHYHHACLKQHARLVRWHHASAEEERCGEGAAVAARGGSSSSKCDDAAASFSCPAHVCTRCAQGIYSEKRLLLDTRPVVRCLRCPNAYHEKCVPRGVYENAMVKNLLLCPVPLPLASPSCKIQEHSHEGDNVVAVSAKMMDDAENLSTINGVAVSPVILTAGVKRSGCHPPDEDKPVAKRSKEVNVDGSVGLWHLQGDAAPESSHLPTTLRDPHEPFPWSFELRDDYETEVPVVYPMTGVAWTPPQRKIAFSLPNRIVSKAEKLEMREPPPPYERIRINQFISWKKPSILHYDEVEVCNCTPEDGCRDAYSCLNRGMSIECNKKRCGAGDACQNQRLQKRLYCKTKVKRTKDRGYALFTTRGPSGAVPAGTLVAEYVGEIINAEEMSDRLDEMQANGNHDYYFFEVFNDFVIDAGRRGGIARFMNHSCDPNCVTEKWNVGAQLRVGIFTTVDVPADTELTYDYNFFGFWDESVALECKCGSANCSGQLGKRPKTEKELEEEEEQRKQQAKEERRKKRESRKLAAAERRAAAERMAAEEKVTTTDVAVENVQQGHP